MVPLHLYRSNPASLRKPQWGIDTSVLSPWAVMSWGMKQLKGVVVGSEEATPRLQAQELVLVENLKVGWLSGVRIYMLTIGVGGCRSSG